MKEKMPTLLVADFSDGARPARKWDNHPSALTYDVMRGFLQAARPGCKVFSPLETPDCPCVIATVYIARSVGGRNGTMHQWAVEEK